MSLRRALSRLLLRILGPELRETIRAELFRLRAEISAEIKRVAEAEANMAGAVALTISGNQARMQDQAVLATVEKSFDSLIAALSGRTDATPGDTKPAREDASFDVLPPNKLH